MVAPVVVASDDIAFALDLAEELARRGQPAQAAALQRLAAFAAAQGFESGDEPELAADEQAALARGDADILAGRIVPNEVVVRGGAAVRNYRRRRDRHGLEAAAAAAVEAYRQAHRRSSGA